MLNIVMMSVTMKHNMPSVHLLNVVMWNAVMQSVLAPNKIPKTFFPFLNFLEYFTFFTGTI
jgi:hypothetical protein